MKINLIRVLFIFIVSFFVEVSFANKKSCKRVTQVKKLILEVLSYESFKNKYSKLSFGYKKLKFKKKPLGWSYDQSDGLVEILGKGYRALVALSNEGRVYKIARGEKDDMYKLYLEYQINKHLKSNFDTYSILVDDIVGHHPTWAFLEKLELNQSFIASNMILENSDLSKIQKQALEDTFNSARKYADDHNIGLDLKASNLFWVVDKKKWLLFDSGPRTSYLPFGYTTDLQDFNEYLKVWLLEEPEIG